MTQTNPVGASGGDLCSFCGDPRYPGGAAEAHPDDVAAAAGPSVAPKCLLHQVTAAPPPMLQPSGGDGRKQTSQSEKCLFSVPAVSQVISVETTDGA